MRYSYILNHLLLIPTKMNHQKKSNSENCSQHFCFIPIKWTISRWFQPKNVETKIELYIFFIFSLFLLNCSFPVDFNLKMNHFPLMSTGWNQRDPASHSQQGRRAVRKQSTIFVKIWQNLLKFSIIFVKICFFFTEI